MMWKGLLFLISSLQVAAADRPNVLFIAVDDLRCDLGCYGVEGVITPHFDRLAASGVAFSRAYVQQAVCNPSRVSVMTGLRPDTTKVWDLVTDFRTTIPDAVTIPQHFRAHGYRALGFGKIFHNPFPDHASWDEPHHWPQARLWSEDAKQQLTAFRKQMQAAGESDAAIERMRALGVEKLDYPEEEHTDHAIAQQAIDALQSLAAGDQPFFLAAGFVRPHLPFVVPRKYWDLYDPAEIPLATNAFLPRGAPAVAFGDKSMGGLYELRDYMDFSAVPSPLDGSLSESEQRRLKHGYYASISFIDAQVGRLLDEVDRLGIADKTLIVLWSDHGWKLGEHNGWCKQTNYEVDTRAPLMIRAPEMKANGTLSNALVEFIDVFPTLCELASLPVPQELEGTSLAPILKAEKTHLKDAAFSQFPRTHEGREFMGCAVRTDRYRYIEWRDRDTGELLERELYDHETDPQENNNIADGKPEVIAPLAARMARQLDPGDWKPVAATRNADRQQRTILGWTVHVHRELLEDERETTEHALTLLEQQLQEIVRVVPARAVAELKKVPLYVSPPYPGTRPAAEFHPDAGWLEKNGRDPAMARAVEFTNSRIFEQEMSRTPNVTLHELAHAYHHGVVRMSFANLEIKAAYEAAKASGKYDRVERSHGRGKPNTFETAYAMTTPQEYFAETTEAYFSRNDFFPFTREQLKLHDPAMFTLLEKLWGIAPPKGN